jgi:hypothetical protein
MSELQQQTRVYYTQNYTNPYGFQHNYTNPYGFQHNYTIYNNVYPNNGTYTITDTIISNGNNEPKSYTTDGFVSNKINKFTVEKSTKSAYTPTKDKKILKENYEIIINDLQTLNFTWSSYKCLEEHFGTHGKEMGCRTIEEFRELTLNLFDQFRNNAKNYYVNYGDYGAIKAKCKSNRVNIIYRRRNNIITNEPELSIITIYKRKVKRKKHKKRKNNYRSRRRNY